MIRDFDAHAALEGMAAILEFDATGFDFAFIFAAGALLP